jgi:hypothetical protein
MTMPAAPEEKPSGSNMPLYPDEEQIARAVLGPKRAKQWRSIAKFLEDKEGLPRVDVFMGGRYWPAVEFYFKQRNGMHSMPERPLPSRIRYVPTPDRNQDGTLR